MNLLSEQNYNKQFSNSLNDFLELHCQTDTVIYKKWKIFTISATHKTPNHQSIIIIQGRAETSYKYLPLIFELYHADFNVYTFDHLGQGFSSRVGSSFYSYIPNFKDYTESTSVIIDHYKLENFKVIGNSMGCAITIHLINENKIKTQQVALVAPMILWNNINPLLRYTFFLLSKIVNAFNLLLKKEPSPFFGQIKYIKPNFESNNKTHSYQRYNFYHKIYEENPTIPVGGVTFEWIRQIMLNPVKIIKAPQTDLIIFLAENELIVNNTNTISVIENSKNSCHSIKYEIIRGAYHDILNESDSIRNPVIRKIEAFYQHE